MTEENPTPETTPIVCDFLTKDREFTALTDSIRPSNKNALFDALAAAGITSVLVHFDGYGDSGQIEDIDAVAGDKPRDLPAVEIEIAHVNWGHPEIDRSTCSVRDAIERLAYDFLEQTHGGWENNEGAFGDFTFDVADRSIKLDYNERIETSALTQHNF